ncbi:NAD(P)/FAD-dependent oxidoreductase [Campylobacter ureolyticus]|uniref:NAD(P)/FAD-dependent oxidoreductase n=1 Tax=Campylobacter ureolyticus TaxID=827 RepID=UPI0022B5D6B1|nr:aminoacetone oxidase family FAD-binding enzyme [Campylobacter ureolyticus]MCZ6167472.1 aminoacetone oxidase family FAD-binding enzyme [Campylobacter ureolyticus]
MLDKTIIIGGGVSGLFLAALLNSTNITILEKNSSLGKKLLASGGGKCNITNENISFKKDSLKYYLGDKNFINQIISNLNYLEVLEFFKPLKFEKVKNSQFFCKGDKDGKNDSKSVLNHLKSKITNPKIYLNSEVFDVVKNDDIFKIYTNNGNFECKNLIVASGGLSCQNLGVSDIGYKIASKFHHEISTLNPALVGFSVQKDEFWFKKISGVCFSAKAKILQNNKVLSGDLLFTHRGISGPLMMNASLFWQKGKISINFLPNFDFDKFKNSKKQITSILPLPKSFIKEFLKISNLEDKQFFKLSNLEFQTLKKLQNYEFSPAGNFGYSKAEITKGGIKTDFIDENCQSKLVKNLYFIGEVLDVGGMIGGFNIHFAFACAKAASKALK